MPYIPAGGEVARLSKSHWKANPQETSEGGPRGTDSPILEASTRRYRMVEGSDLWVQGAAGAYGQKTPLRTQIITETENCLYYLSCRSGTAA
jgi:hypothetical protein